MGTKQSPGRFDCYAKALPDEPMFVLLARDPDFARLVRKWAARRERDIECGERPMSDMPAVCEARDIALAGQDWRRKKPGRWRVKTEAS